MTNREMIMTAYADLATDDVFKKEFGKPTVRDVYFTVKVLYKKQIPLEEIEEELRKSEKIVDSAIDEAKNATDWWNSLPREEKFDLARKELEKHYNPETRRYEE